jgi:hypothetical protein
MEQSKSELGSNSQPNPNPFRRQNKSISVLA